MRLFLAVLTAGCVFAADWPQWRGPNRDGVVPDLAEPKTWPDKLSRKWAVTAGEGHSSPIAAGGKIFLHSRQGEQEVVAAYDPTTGKTLWRASYAAPYTMNSAATRHGKGVKSTPAVAGGRLFTYGIAGVLSAFAADSGKLLWRKEFAKRHASTSPLYGSAMSPLVEGGLVIVHVGGHGDGALTAFDAATGEEKWRWTSDGPGYGSPIVVPSGAVRQVVFMAQNMAGAVNAANGELRWKVPLRSPYDQNSVTPLLHRGTLILSGLGFGIVGMSPGGSQKWHLRDPSMYMSSPVPCGDLVFGMSHLKRGQFFALDPTNGKTSWSSEGREAENAAILSAGPLLLILKNTGELVVARAGAKGLEPLKRYTVAESETWAHPAPLGGNGILVKDATTLALWQW